MHPACQKQKGVEGVTLHQRLRRKVADEDGWAPMDDVLAEVAAWLMDRSTQYEPQETVRAQEFLVNLAEDVVQ